MAKGYYSIIQYCPDASRLEAVNLGVALFCPEPRFLQASFGRSRSRVSCLFGKQDWDFIALQQSAIEDRFNSERQAFQKLHDLENFIARRANAVTMTPPRFVKVDDPKQELESLLRQMVGSQAPAAPKVPNIAAELGGLLQTAGVSSRLRKDVVVHPPALPKPFRAPFAYQNGRLNLIEAIRFDSETATTEFNKASAKAVEGRFLSDYRDPEFGALSLVVVGRFSGGQVRERETAKAVFEKNGVPLYTLDALGPLIEEIRDRAH